MNMHQGDLTPAIEILTESIKATANMLREKPADKAALNRKRGLDRAVRILEWARTLGLSGGEDYVVLPMTKTQTPSSEFRIIEDHETDERTFWTEVEVNGERLRLLPGDIVISAPSGKG